METDCQQLANNYIRTGINPCQIRSKFYKFDREFRLKRYLNLNTFADGNGQ